jgi:hypothetical protein
MDHNQLPKISWDKVRIYAILSSDFSLKKLQVPYRNSTCIKPAFYWPC